MRDIQRQRRETDVQGGYPLGVNNRFGRVWGQSIEATSTQAMFDNAPVDLSDDQPLQNANGDRVFMVGYSAVGGPDPIS